MLMNINDLRTIAHLTFRVHIISNIDNTEMSIISS